MNLSSSGPFIEIIEWIEQDPNLLMLKFPDQDKEIKNGAKLIVRESQAALFLNQGVFADDFSAGTFSLATENIPILSKLKGWKYGFQSPFKADVYYFSTKDFVNLKWGTPAPILLRDPQFGPIRIKAFGSYNIKISDVRKFFSKYAGTFPILTVFELEHQLRDFIAPIFAEVLAQANISALDIAGNLSALNQKIQPLIAPHFEQFGIDVTQFTISSATLPKEVNDNIDKISSMNMIDDMNKFQQFNTSLAIGKDGNPMQQSLQDAAALGLMMQGIAQQNIQQNTPQQSTQNQEESVVYKLKKLKEIYDLGLIEDTEYQTKKTELLDKL
ncbi:SPFH domain-containing protein [Empedobacter falsenii]|uniref:SPFH domain-containing protein n=1 Tax=Empedobacter falsenii TaxID=343874 RepID=UPI002577E6F5|nr:SPFH domain-containing protein [Empedobacter falsenii]MDM1299031.1 SPFH domain-containing protein [Empedobacter falsenii]MDM1318824.1 SPFH domain-containing protein [Empedobacter falsenii]